MLCLIVPTLCPSAVPVASQGHSAAVTLAVSPCWHRKHRGHVFALEPLLLAGVLAFVGLFFLGSGRESISFSSSSVWAES